jgi:hypothetical protein
VRDPVTGRSKIWIVGAVAGLAAGGALLLAVHRVPREATSPAPSAVPPQPAGPSAPQGAPWTRSWELGLQYAHALDFAQTIALPEPGKPPAAAQPADRAVAPPDASALRLSLHGELVSTIVDAGEDEFHVQYQLRPAAFEFGAPGTQLDAKSRETLLTALRSPFYVTFDRAGAARDLHIDPRVDALSQGLLRALVTSLQVVLPATERAQWPARELDATGEFEARYARAGAPRRVEKTRVRYLSMATPEGLRPLAAGMRIAPAGRTDVVLDERLWIDTLRGVERIEVFTGLGAEPTVRGTIEVAARQLAQRRAADLIGAFHANRTRLVPAGLAVVAFAPERREDRLRRILAGGTLRTLTAELRGMPGEESVRGPATARAMQRLTALFLLHPDEADAVPALVRGERDRNTYSSLIGSLSSASTAQAIAALARIAGDASTAHSARVDAVAALGVAKQPSEIGLEQLRELAASGDDELRRTAVLALGSTEQSLRARGDPAASGVLRDLERATAAATDPEERSLQLSALANTANAAAVPAIEDALRSDSEQIREAGVRALRIIDDARADALLAARMVADSSPSVRRGAVFASGFRPLGPLLPALEAALRSDPVDAVRLDVVRLLGANRTEVASAAQLLRRASESDPNAEIRQIAAGFLRAVEARP